MERYLGVVVQAKEFNLRSLTVALRRILDDEHFTSALYHAQLKFRNRPQSVLELAVWHAEQLIAEPRFFKEFPQTEALAQNFFVSHSLDVLMVPFVILMAVVINVVRLIIVLVTGRSKSRRNSKQSDLELPKKRKRVKKTSKKSLTIQETTNILKDIHEKMLKEEKYLLNGEEMPLEEKKDM